MVAHRDGAADRHVGLWGRIEAWLDHCDMLAVSSPGFAAALDLNHSRGLRSYPAAASPGAPSATETSSGDALAF